MNFLMLLVGAHLALMNSSLSDLKVDPAEWTTYKLKYGKSYEASEDSIRSLLYAQNKLRVEEFNGKQEEFTMSLNHLADLSDIELKARNNYKLPKNLGMSSETDAKANKFLEEILNDESMEIPDKVDWRDVKGRVTDIRNQGLHCSSSRAFAAVGLLEGQEAMRKGKNGSADFELIGLSEQNLIDCDTTIYGCAGGNVQNALNFIAQQGGIQDLASYPYEPVTGTCQFDKSKTVITDAGFATLPSGDEEALKKVVAKYGPVATAMDASLPSYTLYHGGVYNEERCLKSGGQVNHAVLIVGYGTDPTYG